MKLIRGLFIFIICVMMSVPCLAEVFTVEEFGIKNIEIPEEYMTCTQEKCDEEFKEILTANGLGFSSWVNDVMKPNGYYIYAMTKSNKCIYVAAQKNDLQEIRTEKDGSKTHPLMSDYNMLHSADDKAEIINNIKDGLVLQGVSAGDISLLRWAELNDETVTPYLEYICSINGQYVHSFETIYNASKISFQFTSTKEFGEKEKEEHAQLVINADLGKRIDYTEAQDIAHENLQNKLAEETNSGENTKILRYILSAFIAVIIVFAIFLSVKTQSKKRKRAIIAGDDENTNN